MSTPAGYLVFCRHRRISPFHPREEWSADDHKAYYRWKRDLYVSKWQRYRELGLHKLWSRDALRMRVAEDWNNVLDPPPSRPWLRCDCHPYSPVRTKESGATMGLAYIRSFGRGAA